MESETLLKNGFFSGLKDLLQPTKHTAGPYKGRKSKTSQSLKCTDEDFALLLFNAFNLGNGSDLETFRKGYRMAVTGDGNEESNILTIHASSLLALLCFFSVSPEHPLTIGKDTYTEVMFEVKNVVIKADGRKPSNIDVLLVSKSEDGNVRKLLFLESKFTEYLTHRRMELASKYQGFYTILKEGIPDLKFNIGNYKKRHQDGNKSTVFGLWEKGKYLDGIKQAFSHLLGIATWPANDRNPLRHAYPRYYAEAKEIEFATIAHDWEETEFNRYSELYTDTFRIENQGKIKDALKKAVPNGKIGSRLKIRPEILKYRDVFRGFNLPGIVRKAYQL